MFSWQCWNLGSKQLIEGDPFTTQPTVRSRKTFLACQWQNMQKSKPWKDLGRCEWQRSLIFRAPSSHPMASEPSDSFSLWSYMYIYIYIYVCACENVYVYMNYIIYIYNGLSVNSAILYLLCSLPEIGYFTWNVDSSHQNDCCTLVQAASFASPRRKNTVQQFVVQCSSADRTTGDRK